MPVYALIGEGVEEVEKALVRLKFAELAAVRKALAHDDEDVRPLPGGAGEGVPLRGVFKQAGPYLVQRLIAVALGLLYVQGAGRGDEVHDRARAELVVVPVHVYAVAVHEAGVQAEVGVYHRARQGQRAAYKPRDAAHFPAGEKPPGPEAEGQRVYEAKREGRRQLQLIAAGDVQGRAQAAEVDKHELPAAELDERVVDRAEGRGCRARAQGREARPAQGVQKRAGRRHPERAELVQRPLGRAGPAELAQGEQLRRGVPAYAAEKRLAQPGQRREIPPRKPLEPQGRGHRRRGYKPVCRAHAARGHKRAGAARAYHSRRRGGINCPLLFHVKPPEGVPPQNGAAIARAFTAPTLAPFDKVCNSPRQS